MYIYGGKDEQGNTVSDLFVVNVSAAPYRPHLVLSGFQSSISSHMVLLKSQHFCEAVCGKLLVFGCYMTTATRGDSAFGLWLLDLDTLQWELQDCALDLSKGGWNYFTVISESNPPDGPDKVTTNSLFFLGNTDAFRPQGYDHFRDAFIINAESLGLYDIHPPHSSLEFAQLLDHSELSDFVIVPATGEPLRVHQVILITRWPHFGNIYKSGMIEAQERRMEMAESYETVLVFIKYLYSGRLDPGAPWDVVCDVLVMANMYLLQRLKKICCERLYKHHLSIESCGTVLEKAILAEETGLKTLTLDFMFRHYGLILKADIVARLPQKARLAFYDAVPDDAILETASRRIGNVEGGSGVGAAFSNALLASPGKHHSPATVDITTGGGLAQKN
ncbi:hypothetical protein BX666DRAFT_1858070 [Dichotomocladium elegans]|nr:hypothetical protein BX666DRAFT_1858070 [Dichotomocladium elegans]